MNLKDREMSKGTIEPINMDVLTIHLQDMPLKNDDEPPLPFVEKLVCQGYSVDLKYNRSIPSYSLYAAKGGYTKEQS